LLFFISILINFPYFKKMLFSSFISKCFGRIEATYFYSKKVHLYYANPKNVGSLDKNSLDTGTGIVGAPACGDVMKLQIKVI